METHPNLCRKFSNTSRHFKGKPIKTLCIHASQHAQFTHKLCNPENRTSNFAYRAQIGHKSGNIIPDAKSKVPLPPLPARTLAAAVVEDVVMFRYERHSRSGLSSPRSGRRTGCSAQRCSPSLQHKSPCKLRLPSRSRRSTRRQAAPALTLTLLNASGGFVVR